MNTLISAAQQPTSEEPASGALPAQPVAPAQPAALEEPGQGGYYIRHPVTGALSLNPAFIQSTDPQE